MAEHFDQVEVWPVEQYTEAIDILAAAFQEHPMLPASTTDRFSRRMVVALFDAFAAAPDRAVLGIRRDGKLACVALVFQDGYDPPLLTLLRFLWRMVRIAGIRLSLQVAPAMLKKHNQAGKRLEIMLLGTHRDYQGHGMGRAMLRHIYAYAQARDYDAITLEVAKQTPAFGLYTKEGFVIEKEVKLPMMPLCWMRRDLDARFDSENT